MNITDIFIKRPVLATVVSLLILLLGTRSAFELPVRQFPQSQSATVTITTTYYGADQEVIAGFITAPLENVIAQAQGIDYLTSTSLPGVSTIVATLRLNYDGNRALTEINTKVNSVLNQLPVQAQQPKLEVSTGEIAASMYISFNSDVLSPTQITDYLVRVVQPKLQSLPGMQSAEISGSRFFALRAWLDPQRLAAVGLTATDVYTALGNNNYVAGVGSTKGQMVSVNLATSTDLHSVEDFRNLIIKRKGDAFVRLQDVANVSMGAENYEFEGLFDGQKSIQIAIKAAPDANLLSVTKSVRDIFPTIKAQLPSGLTGLIVYDATMFVNSSIEEVIKTLIESLLIVTAVVFLFLGSFRSIVIPVIAIPLSLVGGFAVMLAFGYTINLLTLLALVLAIGLVVDDAIIIVENIDRYMKQGMPAVKAALLGARELTSPIIAISVVLIAVYVPIGFQGGLTGALFTEFAFTLAGAVAVSAVIALTLSPVMCSRLLRADQHETRVAMSVDRHLEKTRSAYLRQLNHALDNWPVIVTFALLITGLIFVFSKLSQSELAPEEDQGYVMDITTGSPTANLQQMALYSKQVYDINKTLPEYAHMVQFDGYPSSHGGFAIMIMKPWDERERTGKDILQELQLTYQKSIAGAKVVGFSPPALPGGGNGLPLQFVINTTDKFANLNEVIQTMMQKAQDSGKFYYLDVDLKYDKPQTTVVIDHDKAATLGLSMRDVGSALGSILGGGYVNHFSIAGRSYKVIPQVKQADRLNAQQLLDTYYLRTASGDMVPASTIATLKTDVVPEGINHFQQLNSATITGVAGMPLGDTIKLLTKIAQETLPQGYGIDFGGQSRQAVKESSGFAMTLLFSIVIIYLTLAAQFESFRDPLIVMMSVPMAIFGAMIFIFEGAATLNIYTQVGLVTLVGLIAKHGILLVEFANEEQRRGKTKRQAIISAASTRLRPILMTTAAMTLGVLPLIFATGAGAVGRNNMGIVIASGISIGTLFTLFVVPAMYMFIAGNHAHGESLYTVDQ